MPAQSVYPQPEESGVAEAIEKHAMQLRVENGDFNLRGFEIARDAKNRNSVLISKVENNVSYPREISSGAFSRTLFSLFGWNVAHKYRVMGSLFENGDEIASACR